MRSFELLSDVCASWNSDKIVNLLVIKRTLLAPLLSRTVRFSFFHFHFFWVLICGASRLSQVHRLFAAGTSSGNTSVANGRNDGWSCESTVSGSRNAILYAQLVRMYLIPMTYSCFAQGKDATFLCSLSNFDAYYVTRVHKAPKPYVFAVKSTDSLTFFENTADYVHIFSCGESEGKNWLEKILLARVRF